MRLATFASPTSVVQVLNLIRRQSALKDFKFIQAAIEEGKILADLKHPLSSSYPNQRVLIVEFNDYAYIVPYVEDEVKIFLKTIYPSRKMTKKYLREGGTS